MVDYSERLSDAMRVAGISTSQLAKALGVTYQAVRKVETGLGKFNTANNFAAAKVLGVNSFWLATGKGARPAVNSSAQSGGEGAVPVVGSARFGDATPTAEIEADELSGRDLAWLTRDPSAYAIKCLGDDLKPRIRHGEFVVLEPGHAVAPGDEVLVKTKVGRVALKQLAYAREGLVYLDSINETSPRISVPADELEVMHYVAGLVKAGPQPQS